MASMPGLVTKTATFKLMDDSWNADVASYLNEYENKSFDDLLAIAPVAPATKQHVKDDWVDAQVGWLGPNAKQVIRRGLYWAMRVALFVDPDSAKPTLRPEPLPICSAWICSGAPGKDKKKKDKKGQDQDVPRFEVVALASDHQVTLLFLTPPPKNNPVGHQAFQPVWSTRLLDPYGPEAGEQTIEEWPPSDPVTVTVRPFDYTAI